VFLSRTTGDRPPELDHLGPDPLDPRTTPAVFAAALTRRRTALKPALMDQRTIAGLGNIYSDEVLHRVGLRHDHRVADLSPEEVGRIRAATRRILLDAIRAGGSSLRDGQYVDLEGRPGRYQLRHRVYGRAGEPCTTCGAIIVRERWSGRSTSSCPGCQPR
jgi:formamidopyrimidine-DNA glycosylase